MDIITQLEEFKAFIDTINPTVVSNIDMRRKYYTDHVEEAKKSDLYDKSTDIFKKIIISFIQLNNANAAKTIADIDKKLALYNEGLNYDMWSELIVKITNSITSSNLTITNTKQHHAKLITIIEKYNTGFINEFIKYQLSKPFSIEILDCIMYIYYEFKEIENDLLSYMSKNDKDTFTELLKFINMFKNDYSHLYTVYIKTVKNMTGYMKYVNEEIISIINS